MLGIDALLSFILERLWGLLMFILRKRPKMVLHPLVFGHYSGGRSVEPQTRLYEWIFTIPVTDKANIGITDLKLRIRQGRRQMELLPLGLSKPYLKPTTHTQDLNLVFRTIGGLQGGTQAEDEECTLMVEDGDGCLYQIPLGVYTE